MADRLVAEGRARLRKRRASAQTITAAQIETFLATLAETCNVVRSATAAGISSSWAYKLRRRDAAFRTGWAQAVREGYAKLELVLLERAMKGTPRAIKLRGGGERIIREYSTPLAVALLRRHAETADSAAYEPGEDEMRELRDKILAKLERVRKRDGGDGGDVETKGFDRIGLIVWGIRRQARQASSAKGEGFSP